MKNLKKFFSSLIIITILFNLVLNGLVGLNTVQADTIHITYDVSYETTEVTDWISSGVKASPPPGKARYAELVWSKTRYAVAYVAEGYVHINVDDIDAFGERKKIKRADIEYTITKFEKVKKERYNGRNTWKCYIRLHGYLYTDYEEDGKSYKDFRGGRTVNFIGEISANPVAIETLSNKRYWKISIPRKTVVKDSSSSSDNLLGNLLGVANSLVNGLKETANKIAENAKNQTTVVETKNNQTQTSNQSTGNQSTANQGQIGTAARLDHTDMSDDARRLYIRNLYKRVLKREPSNSEIDSHFNYNTDAEAINVIFSTEANNKNAINNMTNAQFVEACYKFLLNRSADASGKTTWNNYLASGKSRRDLVSVLVQSTEFKNQNKQNIATITLDEKLCSACYTSLIEKGISVIKPTSTTIKMYSNDVDKVEELNLAGKGLTSLSGLSNFKKLKKLNLSNNKITDLSGLSGLSNLQDLDISKNGVTSLESIKGLTNLTRLYANGNSIETVTGISNMTKLQSLSLSECKVKKFTADLSHLKQLEEIKIENNNLEDDSLTTIATARNLKRLHISKNKITSLANLAPLANLEEIYADNNSISYISGFGRIKKLLVRNNGINLTTSTGEITVPHILSEVMDSRSAIYTQNSNIKCENCKIENGKIVINTGAITAKITINDGSAKQTQINIKNTVKVVTVKDRVLAERLKTEFNLANYTEKDGKFELSIPEVSINNKKSINLSGTDDSKIKDISGIETLKNLVSIDLSNNQISNFEPLSHLEKLQTLIVKFNGIGNLNSLKTITGLLQLDASNNRIESLNGIEDMSNLHYLVLSNNNIQNNLAPLNNLKDSLEILALNNNKISDVSGLSQLKLERLYLAYNEIGDISAIDTSNLDTLKMDNNSITINTTEKMVDLPNMIKEENSGAANFECTGCTISNDKIVLDEGEKVASAKVLTGTYRDTVITVQDLNALEGPQLTVSYELKNDNRQMLVTVRSNKEIQPLLGWDRTENSTCLSKTYTYNVTNETIVVTDMYGNETEQTIQFSGVQNADIPDLSVSYNQKMKTNEDVTVTISSSERLYNTHGWTLSDDGKSLRRTYSENTNHTYTTVPILTEQMFNIQMQPKNIEVELASIDKVAPELDVEYSTTSTTKSSVRVTVWANEEIDVFGRGRYTRVQKLEQNGDKKYGLVFYCSENATEEVIIRDMAYNTTPVTISVNNIDKGIDGLYSKSSTSNATKDNISIIVGANENITVNKNNQAKLNNQRALTAEANKMINNMKRILGSDNSLYVVADNNEFGHAYTNILLAENDGQNSTTQTGNQIEIEVTDRELGSFEVTDSASNTEIVLYNSGVIDRDEIEISEEKTYNDDGSVSVKLISNRPLMSSESLGNWVLSEDGLELTQTFNKNSSEVLHLQDYMNNVLDYEFSIDGFKNINYSIHYIPLVGTDEVSVVITSDVELQPITDWEIADGGKALATTINMYNKQIITIYDIEGNSEDVTIEYNPDILNLDVETTDDTQANKLLPNTGVQNVLKVIIVAIVAITLFTALKRRKRSIYRNKIKKN